jgi:hypothetical protein
MEEAKRLIFFDYLSYFKQVLEYLFRLGSGAETGIQITGPFHRKFYDDITQFDGSEDNLQIKKKTAYKTLTEKFSAYISPINFKSTLRVCDIFGEAGD